MKSIDAWVVLEAMAPQVRADAPELRRARADLDERIGVRARSVHRRRWLASAGVAAATAVVLVAWPGGGSDAFASWVPTPAPATQPQVNAAQSRCDAALSGATEQIADIQRRFGVRLPNAPTSMAVLAGRVPLLSEQRGDFTFVLSANADWTVGCLAAPAVSEVLTEASTSAVSAQPVAPADDQIDVLGSSDEGDNAGTEAALAYGRAGAEVAAVELIITAGPVVRATVSGGYWSAWWPSTGQGLPDARVHLVLQDGSSRDLGGLSELSARSAGSS